MKTISLLFMLLSMPQTFAADPQFLLKGPMQSFEWILTAGAIREDPLIPEKIEQVKGVKP